MKILLLGATGRTGKHIIEEAIKRGHEISAIARDPEKLKDYQIIHLLQMVIFHLKNMILNQ